MTEQQESLLMRLENAMCEFDAGSPHLIHHFIKVHGFARQIGLAMQLDSEEQFILEAAALTHDIGIPPALKLYGSSAGPYQEKLGPPEAEKMMNALGFAENVIRRVCFLIGHHHTVTGVDALDWRILLEADFLVNMIEGNESQQAIDHFRDTVFETNEGKKLLAWIRPAKETDEV